LFVSYSGYMPQAVEQALELIRENRPESIDRALALLQNTIYSFSMKVCGHPQDAEDTMQEVLLKSLPYLPKFESSQALSVWLYKVARNRCLSNRRGQKNAVRRHVSLDELMPNRRELRELIESKELSPETRVLRGESEQSLRDAVLKVPPQYRFVLVLHDMEGLNTAEVARVTGLREGTVRVRLHRARLMVRQHLAPMAKAGRLTPGRHAVAAEAPKRSRRCQRMFAALSDYMDGLFEDVHCEEIEKHLHECKPCVAFFDSLKSAVDQCRSYHPHCDAGRAKELREELLRRYRAAVAALPRRRVGA
jgi:RNA polymerase sigma-70 factor, ECF subfamily